MAIFNPNVPEGAAPSYFGLSQAGEGDKSMGTLLAGAGNLLSGGLNAADALVQANIRREVFNTVQAERGNEMQVLEDVTGTAYSDRLTPPGELAIGQFQPVSPADANPNYKVIPGSVATPVPEGLQRAQGEMKTLGGMVSTTSGKAGIGNYYIGKLAMLGQDLTERFPGYSKMINQEIEAQSGIPGVNAYVKNMQAILAENLSNVKSDREKGLAVAGAADVQDMPGIKKVISDISTGNTGGRDGHTYALLATQDWRAKKAAIATKAIELNDWKGDKERQVDKAEKSLTDMSYKYINTGLVNLFGNDISYQQFSSLVRGVQEGTVQVTAAEAQQMSQAFHAFHQSIREQIITRANTKGEKEEFTHAQILKDDGVNKQVDAALSSLDHVSKLIDDKDWGAAARAANAIKQGTTDTSTQLWNSTNLSVQRYVRAQAAIRQLHGDHAGNELMKSALADNLPGDLKPIVEGLKMDVVVGGRPLTQAIKDLKAGKVGLGDTASDKADRGAYSATTAIVDKITADVPVSMKKAIIEGSYGPQNGLLLQEFKDDYRDSKGNIVPGKQSLFARMTSPQTTDEVWKISQTPGNEKAWGNYKVWAEKSHQMLFSATAKDMNLLAANPNVNLFYDKDFNTVGVTVNPKLLAQPGMSGLLPKLKDTVAQLNQGLSTMGNIVRKEKGEEGVPAYLLNLMVGEGIRPDRISGTGKLMNAVINSEPPKKEGDSKVGVQEEPSLFSKAVTGVKNFYNQNADKPYTGGETIKKGIDKVLDFFTPTPAKGAEIVGSANNAVPGRIWGVPGTRGFKENHLETIQTSSGKPVVVNKVAAQAFKGFLDDLEATGYKINDISGYSFREKKGGGGGISQHAYGNAIDINPDNNPFQRKLRTDMPDNVREIAMKHGISWGGDWRSIKDAMHFEYTGKKLAELDDNGNPIGRR